MIDAQEYAQNGIKPFDLNYNDARYAVFTGDLLLDNPE